MNIIPGSSYLKTEDRRTKIVMKKQMFLRNKEQFDPVARMLLLIILKSTEIAGTAPTGKQN